MAAPIIFTSIVANLIKGIGTAVRYGGKAGAQQGAKFGGEFAKGFGDSLFKRNSATAMGANAARSIEASFTAIFRDIGYRMSRQTLARQQRGLLAGVSGANITNVGNALSLYGGSGEDFANTIKSLTSQLTGLSYGNAGFLKQAMMYSNGQFNIFGSGRNGFVTAQEALDEFARIGKDMDIGSFNALADVLRVDAATRVAIREGDYELLKTRQYMTSEDERRQKELGFAERKTAANWERMGQLWASRTAPFWESWENFKGSIWNTVGNALERSMRDGNQKLTEETAERNYDTIAKILTGENLGLWDNDTAKTNEDLVLTALLDDKKKYGITYTRDELMPLFSNLLTSQGYKPGDTETYHKRVDGMSRLLDAYETEDLGKLKKPWIRKDVKDDVTEFLREQYQKTTGRKAPGRVNFNTDKQIGVETQSEYEERKRKSFIRGSALTKWNKNLREKKDHYEGLSPEERHSLDGYFLEKERERLGRRPTAKDINPNKIDFSRAPSSSIFSRAGSSSGDNRKSAEEMKAELKSRQKRWDAESADLTRREKIHASGLSPEAYLYSIARNRDMKESAETGFDRPLQQSIKNEFNINVDSNIEVKQPAIQGDTVNPMVKEKWAQDIKSTLFQFQPEMSKIYGGQ